jgi:hypothetical protein
MTMRATVDDFRPEVCSGASRRPLWLVGLSPGTAVS